MTGSEAGSWEVKGGLGLGTKHGMLQVQSERKGLQGGLGEPQAGWGAETGTG